MSASFKYVARNVISLGTDEQVLVWRQRRIKTTDDVYRPVAEYIKKNGFVLVESEQITDDKHIPGVVIKEWFTTAESRHILMAYPAVTE